MNIAAIMKIPDQATRNFAYAQALQIDELKAEIEALKRKPPNIVGFRPKGGYHPLSEAMNNIAIMSEKNGEKR
jgi:hypothetical protein